MWNFNGPGIFIPNIITMKKLLLFAGFMLAVLVTSAQSEKTVEKLPM
jgi:hypothetical protein